MVLRGKLLKLLVAIYDRCFSEYVKRLLFCYELATCYMCLCCVQMNLFEIYFVYLQRDSLITYVYTRYVVGLYWVPGHAGIRDNEIADELARGGSVRCFLGPEPALGVSRRDVQHRLNRWLVNQQWARWRGLGITQRQVREFISRPDLDAKAKLMSFNRTQSRAVIGLLTGDNTPRRHLHLLGPADSPLYRRCGVEEETSVHIPCECEALASLRHAYLGSFFLEPEDIKSISLGAI
jgi:hypothetical protein